MFTVPQRTFVLSNLLIVPLIVHYGLPDLAEKNTIVWNPSH